MGKEILREIGKIYRGLNTLSEYLIESIDLKKGQYQFIVRINENPGINQKKLSSLLLVDKTTTAKAVNKLVDKGYILKKTNQSDKRNFNLYLTEKGKKTSVFLGKEEQFATKISLKTIDDLEQKKLLNQLVKISKNVTLVYSEIKERNKENILASIKTDINETKKFCK